MQNEAKTLVVFEGKKFNVHSYSTEKELEEMIPKYSKEIFGGDTFYCDIKKKITSKKGIAGIPDAYLIDFEKKKLCIIEIELSSHNIVSHILNQLIRFKVAMNNPETRNQLASYLHDELVKKNPRMAISLAEIEKIVKRGYSIVIIIDGVSEKLSELFNILSQDGTEVLAIPFETYIDSKHRYLHRFTTFTKAALKKESKKWTFTWTTVPIKKHFNNITTDAKEIFSALSKQICLLPYVMEKSRKSWVTYQTSPLKNFCTIKIHSDHLEIHLKCDESFRDEKNLSIHIKRTPSWTFNRVVKINSRNDISYLSFANRG